jgi:serine protease Do
MSYEYGNNTTDTNQDSAPNNNWQGSPPSPVNWNSANQSKGIDQDGYYRYNFPAQTHPAPAVAEARTERRERMRDRKGGKALGYIASLLAVGMISGAAGGGVVFTMMSQDSMLAEAPAVTVQAPQENIPLPDTAPQTPPAVMPNQNSIPAGGIAGVVEKASDCVVEIQVSMTVMNPFFGGETTRPGSGSGVIISADGYVVTNDHVISGADEIKVRTKDGAEYEAVLVGTDEQTDLAVLKLDASGLTAVTFGDSDLLKVGETAIAIGNPLGTLGGTVTSGIVSALNREITVEGTPMTLIQTSAPVNPGNSGGGLFNEHGDLIGIVNAKSMSSGFGTAAEGLGFAIPVNQVKHISGEIIEHGYVTGRPEIGIQLQHIFDNQTAFMFRVNEFGVYVLNSTKDNGLIRGDLILTVDGNEVQDGSEIIAASEGRKIGDTIPFTVKRDGKEVSLSVPLSEKVPQYILEQRNSGNPF